MIKIDFVEPKDRIWKRWRSDCAKARLAIEESAELGETVEVKTLYRRKSIKDRIYFSKDGPFRGKCAYCECYITDFQHGDIEHFRPKKGVTDEHDNPISIVNNDGSQGVHPGYYWLAYEWENLLPSCVDCNQASKIDNRKVGKHNRFPVDGAHATSEDELCDEKPLLLNPLFDEPTEHLEVDTQTGLMLEKSVRGDMCIKVFGLNIRERLPENRRKAISQVKVAIDRILHASPPERKEAVLELSRIKEGESEYALAARTFMKEIGPSLSMLFE